MERRIRSGSASWIPCAVLMIALSSQALAAGDEMERRTLVGLQGVHVVVETMEPDAEREGLEKTTLQTDVELMLRRAGIRVLARTEWFATAPHLYLRVSTFRGELPLYAYDIKLALNQEVRLLRDPSITSVATTWEPPGRIGTVGAKNLSTLRERVRDQVDQFINAYLAANPKR